MNKLKDTNAHVLNVFNPGKINTQLLIGTKIEDANDFPDKIKQIYYDHCVHEKVQLYDFVGFHSEREIVCKLENNMYAHFNFHNDFRYDIDTVNLTFGTTLGLLINDNNMNPKAKNAIKLNNKVEQ